MIFLQVVAELVAWFEIKTFSQIFFQLVMRLRCNLANQPLNLMQTNYPLRSPQETHVEEDSDSDHVSKMNLTMRLQLTEIFLMILNLCITTTAWLLKQRKGQKARSQAIRLN